MVSTAGLPTGTVAFLFTDVEGSTRTWELHRQAMSAAMQRHDAILRTEIESRGGYVFTTAGDSFAAAFERVSDAVDAAVAIDDAITNETWPTPESMRIRMGIHLGEAFERDGDYFGPAVNKAARIMSAAHGGQTVLSDPVRALALEADTTDLGNHRLKDLEDPVRVWQLGTGSFPALRTLDQVRHNLPGARTPLVGRDSDIASVAKLIEQHRLVTLLGIGGTGKTRLAVASAAEVAHRFPDGVWFIDLVAAQSIDAIVESVATATGISIAGADLLAAMADALSGRELLLIADNCEHVADEVADLVDHLLDATTDVRILATSREPLRLPDERQLPVEPLSVDARADSPACRLFTATAERVGVEIPHDSLPTIAEIAERLDGHPLSLELAAPQLREITAAELLDRLDERFEILETRRRGRQQRQASLLTVLEGTWSMLDGRERRLLLHLAAFPGTFAIDDIEALTAEVDVGRASRTLAGLNERGLVASDDERHRLLETTKLFARQQWNDEPEPGVFVDRHTTWILDQLIGASAEDHYVGFEHMYWIEEHWEDCRAVEDRLAQADRNEDLAALLASWSGVMTHGSSQRSASTVDRIQTYLESRSFTDRGVAQLNLVAAGAVPARRPRWIGRGSQAAIDLLDPDSDPEAYSSALIIASWTQIMSDPEAALALLDQAQAIADGAKAPRIGDVAIGYAASHLALIGDADQARNRLEQLEARLDPAAFDYGWQMFFGGRFSADVLDHPQRTVAALSDRVARLDDRHPQWNWSLLMAIALASNGDLEQTILHQRRTMQLVAEQGADDGLPDLFLPPAYLAFRLGETDRARRWVEAIRHAPRPTVSFQITTAYRHLRTALGGGSENPLESASIEEIFAEALEWLDTVSAGAWTEQPN